MVVLQGEFICSFHCGHGCWLLVGVESGLEVPCVYCLYGPNIYVDMKELVESLLADGHIICVISYNWHLKKK